MGAVSANALLQAPLIELPLDSHGRPTQAWVGYYQDIADRIGAAGSYDEVVIGPPGVTLTSTVAADIATISLPQGDWEVRGQVWFDVGTGGAVGLQVGIATTTLTIPGISDGGRATQDWAHTASQLHIVSVAPTRFALTAQTTLYLVGRAVFPSGTTRAYGQISARRMR